MLPLLVLSCAVLIQYTKSNRVFYMVSGHGGEQFPDDPQYANVLRQLKNEWKKNEGMNFKKPNLPYPEPAHALKSKTITFKIYIKFFVPRYQWVGIGMTKFLISI